MSLKNKLDIAIKLAKTYREASNKVWAEKWRLRLDFYRFMLPGKIYLQWFFTRHCNLNCSYCATKENNSKDMTNEQRKEALKFLKKKFRPKVLSITGGEPTLKFDELVEFIACARKLGIFPTLNTNGLLLNSEKIKILANAGLRYISFSYDGIPPKDNAEKIIQLSAAATFYGVIPVIQPVFYDKNWDQRMNIVEKIKSYYGFFDETRQLLCFFNPSIVNNVGKGYSTAAEAPPPESEVKKFFAFLHSSKIKYNVKPTYSFLNYMSKNYGKPWHCQNFRWLTINNDGTLRHCNEFFSEFTITDLANKYGLRAFNDFRKECASSCQGCYYECFYDSDGGLTRKIGMRDLIHIEVLARMLYLFKMFNILSDTAEKYFPQLKESDLPKTVVQDLEKG